MNARGHWHGLLIGFCIAAVTVHAGCAQATQRLPVTTLEAGIDSGRAETELRFLVISQPEAFDEVYGRIASLRLPRPATPAVDFATHRVVVALMGTKPTAGYGIRFSESARQQDRTVAIQVLRVSPTEDAILAQIVTNPYVIAVIARDGYTKITFVGESGVVLASVDTPE